MASLLLQAPPRALRTPPAKPEISIHNTVRGNPTRAGRAASGDSREGCSRARGRTCVGPGVLPVSWLHTSLLNDIILNISLQRMSKHHPTRGSGQQTPVHYRPAFLVKSELVADLIILRIPRQILLTLVFLKLILFSNGRLE